MKIFLTEMSKDGEVFPGPNIVAISLKEAEAAARSNGLTVVGEFKEILIQDELMSYFDEKLTGKILH